MVITSIWKNHIGNQEATITFKTVNKHYEWMKWEKRSYIWLERSFNRKTYQNEQKLTQNTDKNYKQLQEQKIVRTKSTLVRFFRFFS